MGFRGLGPHGPSALVGAVGRIQATVQACLGASAITLHSGVSSQHPKSLASGTNAERSGATTVMATLSPKQQVTPLAYVPWCKNTITSPCNQQ